MGPLDLKIQFLGLPAFSARIEISSQLTDSIGLWLPASQDSHPPRGVLTALLWLPAVGDTSRGLLRWPPRAQVDLRLGSRGTCRVRVDPVHPDRLDASWRVPRGVAGPQVEVIDGAGDVVSRCDGRTESENPFRWNGREDGPQGRFVQGRGRVRFIAGADTTEIPFGAEPSIYPSVED